MEAARKRTILYLILLLGIVATLLFFRSLEEKEAQVERGQTIKALKLCTEPSLSIGKRRINTVPVMKSC